MKFTKHKKNRENELAKLVSSLYTKCSSDQEATTTTTTTESNDSGSIEYYEATEAPIITTESPIVKLSLIDELQTEVKFQKVLNKKSAEQIEDLIKTIAELRADQSELHAEIISIENDSKAAVVALKLAKSKCLAQVERFKIASESTGEEKV